MAIQDIFQQGFFTVDPDSTPDQLQRRRERVAQMFSSGQQPRSAVGGGVKLVGGIVEGLRGRSANKLEREKTAEATDQFNRLLGGGNSMSTRGASPFVPSPVTTPEVATGPIPDTPEAVASDTRSALGLPPSLVRTESGGNLGAFNNEVGHGGVRGHGGRGQFGHARLQDAAAAGLVPPGTTPQQYAQMPEAVQSRVEQWHVGQIDDAIQRHGFDQLIGQDLDGDPSTPDVVTRDGLVGVAHLGGIGGMKKFVESRGAYNPSDSFGTSLSEYLVTHGQGGGGQVSAPSVGGGNLQELMAMQANPWLSQSQRAVLGGMIQQAQAEADPLRQLQIQQAQANLNNTLNPRASENKPAGVTELEWRAEQAGLVPGTPEYQSFILNGGADPATFRALHMQALAAGLQEGTPEYQEFMATRGAGNQSFARVTGENLADIETGAAAAAETSRGAAEGKAQSESASQLREMERNMPSLMTVVDQLDALADTATYTLSGRARDEVRKQLGLEPGEGAIARAEYIAIVDNQVLPLLRQTFGAAFTAKEGETLRATLGDADKSPAEKRAVLQAFIAQKQRELVARGGQLPPVETSEPDDDGWVTMPNGVRIREIN